ncbi:MAG: hypothetical protein HQ537_00810 [Parcubacteria group bacterium]|nr:hypothetical protein [Parcubacteria group bacterium]
MRYIIILLTILLLPYFVSAEGIKMSDLEIPDLLNWLDNAYDKTNQKILNPVKQFIDTSIDLIKKENIKGKSEELLDKTEKAIEQKQEELVDQAQEKVKQEVKKGAKNWLKRRLESVEQTLAPLKNKIQKGRGLLREQVYKLKNYLNNWLKG